jgi:hypothetical protein
MFNLRTSDFMERTYEEKMSHAMNLFVYMHPSDLTKDQSEYECDGMRLIKKQNDPSLVKRVLEICIEGTKTMPPAPSYEQSRQLQETLRAKLMSEPAVRKAFASDVLPDSVEVLCDDIAFHASEAYRHFSQKFAGTRTQ